jgi:hypothetical protein
MCEEELCNTYFLHRYVWHVDEWARVFQANPVPAVNAAIMENMTKSVSNREIMTSGEESVRE